MGCILANIGPEQYVYHYVMIDRNCRAYRSTFTQPQPQRTTQTKCGRPHHGIDGWPNGEAGPWLLQDDSTSEWAVA